MRPTARYRSHKPSNNRQPNFESTLPVAPESEGARKIGRKRQGGDLVPSHEQMGCADSETAVNGH